MLGKHLIELVRPLNKKEWKALLRWFQSPSHNTDQGLYQLMSYLQSQAPQFAEEGITKQQLWTVLYADKALKEGVLRVKLRQASKLIEDFKIWQEIQKDHRLQDRLLLQSFARHQPYIRFEKEVQKRLNQETREENQGPDSFFHQGSLLYQLVAHKQFDNYKTNGQYLRQLDGTMDAYFLLMKYRIGMELKNRERILGETYQLRFWEALGEEQSSGLLKENPISQLYQQLFQLLEASEEENLFPSFKISFQKYRSFLPLMDLNNIYYTTLNYLSRKINQGGSLYYEETLAWYQLGLSDGLLTSSGSMSDITFNNIALLGYQNQAFDWTQKFLEDYAPFLDKKLRDDAVKVSLGLGYFFQGQYQATIDILSQHRFSMAYQLRVRLTIIRAFVEQLLEKKDVYENLEKAIAAFESYMKRSKTYSLNTLLPYQNAMRLLKEFMHRFLSKVSPAKNKAWLEKELAIDGRVVAKAWLQQLVSRKI